jgi:molybdenum cofactor cytidylyltransferase
LTTQIETRPGSRDAISVAIILLAAGRASRMGVGAPHKLLAAFTGVPLVRRCAERAVSSCAKSVTVVTGYRRAEIEAALAGPDLDLAHIPILLPVWQVR